jgi:prevent-host-death family protein
MIITIMQSVSAMQVRQKLGEILAKIELRGEEFVIEKGGKPSAVLIPYKKIARIRQRAAKKMKDILMKGEAEGANADLSDEEISQFVDQAIHESRKPL